METNPSKPAHQYAGTSPTGDLNEALNHAIAIAQATLEQELITWRLVETTGMRGGFVGSRQLTVVIEVTNSVTKSQTEGTGLSGDVSVPVLLSGTVTPLSGMSICMDGATHLLRTLPGGQLLENRLKASNPEALEVLESYADTRKSITVIGYPKTGVEGCLYISVYHAGPTEQQLQKLGAAAPATTVAD